MSTVNPSQSNAGDLITAAAINNPVNQLAAVINGSIDATNIADGSVSTTKLASASVTSTKVNFGGGGAGIWWEEIGRTTLASTSLTVTVSSLPARAFLKVIIQGIYAGGTVNTYVQYNGDTAANYTIRYSSNYGADTSVGSQTFIPLSPGALTSDFFIEGEISNTQSSEKIGRYFASYGERGAANKMDVFDVRGKWANTSTQINQITFASATSTFGIGTRIIVLGHD